MNYERPEIMLVADAVVLVQGPKGAGFADNFEPQSPLHTPSAYESDE